jgi:Uma2 family endonuclease
MIVEIGTGNRRYPDMTIDCGNVDLDALTATAPVAVFEMLSKSMRKTDLLINLHDYEATPGIQYYALIAHAEIMR